MKTATISKNGTKPAYSIGGTWVWVSYPATEIIDPQFTTDERYAGFMVEVLMNPTGYDERAAQFALRSYLQRIQDLRMTDPNNQDLVDAAEDAYLQAIAPRVRAWNAEQDGVPVPAPGETDDPEAFRAFYVVPAHLKAWTAQVVREITVPKRPIPPSLPVGSTAITTPTTTAPEQERLDS